MSDGHEKDKKPHFFGILSEKDSRKMLGKRFENFKNDFENYLITSRENIFESALEFVKLMTLSFLPDRIVCCIKKNKEILAVNLVHEVYQFITEKKINCEPSRIGIKDIMETPICVRELNGDKSYERELKFWCRDGFENLRTFLCFDINEIRVELLLPYEGFHCSDSIKNLFATPKIKDFFLKVTNSKEPVHADLHYFDPFLGVVEKEEINLGELFPYLENRMRTIEEKIKVVIGGNHQAWIYHHVKNNPYSRGKAGVETKIKDYIYKKFGFYVSFTTEGKKERFWKYFKSRSGNEGTSFNKIKKTLKADIGLKEDEFLKVEDAKNFEAKFYDQIKEYFPGFTHDLERKSELKEGPFNNIPFNTIFEERLHEVFKVYWNNRTKKFFQSSEVGVASITRFTRLPEFMINLAKDPRNLFYMKYMKYDNPEEKKYYKKILSQTEKFLFIPEVISEYTVLPIIINNAYWGVILIFFDRIGNTEPKECVKKIYEDHRRILLILREIIGYAELGILAEFENFVRDRIIQVRDKVEYENKSDEILKESRRNPLIPDILAFNLDPEDRCKCPITDEEYVILEKTAEIPERIIKELSECKRLKELKDKGKIDWDKWKFVLIYPRRNEERACIIFSGTRTLKEYPDTIKINCMAIADYIESTWQSILSEEEKRKLYIRNAAVAIMTHAFAHDVGSHGLIHISQWLRDKKNFSNGDKNMLINFNDYLFEKSGLWAWLGIHQGRALSGDFIEISELLDSLNEQELYFRNILKSELGVAAKEFNIVLKNKELNGNRILWIPCDKSVGIQAFSTIIETIIRNLKHPLSGADIEDEIDKIKIIEKRKEILRERIILKIDIEDEGPFIKITINDQLKICNDSTIEIKGKKISPWEYIENKLNMRQIIDWDVKPYMPIRGGISEILICSNILRGEDIIELEKEKVPPLASLDSTDRSKISYILYMWKGEPIKILEEEKEIETFNENFKYKKDIPYRFKFLIIQKMELFKKLGKIRLGILENLKNEKILSDVWTIKKNEAESYNNIFKSWLKYWLDTHIDFDNIDVTDSDNFIRFVIKGRKYLLSHGKKALNDPNCKLTAEEKKDICLYCNSNTSLWSNFILKNRQPSMTLENLEIFGTRILFVDERAWLKWKGNSLLFNDKSILECFKSIDLRIENPVDKNELDEIKKGLSIFHFAIFHSSLLEKILCDGNKIENIIRLMKELIEGNKVRYIVITSGKGEPPWMDELRRNINECFFISYYNFERCFKPASAGRGRLEKDYNDFLFFVKKEIIQTLMAK